MRAGAELLIDSPMSRRGKRMLQALQDTLPTGSVTTSEYRGEHVLLVLYGVGLPTRMGLRTRHLAAGGHVAMWDLGYWERENAMRVSIDSTHPSPEQIERSPDDGDRCPEFRWREDGDPCGPVLLIGIGRKSSLMLGLEPLAWERAKVQELRQRFPDRGINWRPKGRAFEHLRGTSPAHDRSIDEVLAGCSLVVCRHSNVAIDACIAGIPVECEDGAALALYRHGAAPARAQRQRFLRRLAWWNWRPCEAAGAWGWMNTMAGQSFAERRSLECA